MKKKIFFRTGLATAVCIVFLLVLAAAAAGEAMQQFSSAWRAKIQTESVDTGTAEITGDIQAGVVKGKRTSYPSPGNPFFFSSKYNPFVGTAYGPPATSHNCTWYAYGRFSEILGKKAALPTGNAGTWYASCTAYKKGKTPQVGAVVCWAYSTGGAGHVAVVEEIKENGDIVTSNSGWSGANFWMQTWTKASGYQGGIYILRGFIYQP